MIENERKYVLRLDPAFEARIRSVDDRAEMGIPAARCEVIHQLYLPGNGRIRVRNPLLAGPPRLFGYKLALPNGMNFEVETPITQADYDRVLPMVERQLRKERWTFGDAGCDWFVDFFHTDARTYFCLVEVELPQDMDVPERIPAAITGQIIYEAARGDKRFSSYALCDVDYATELYNSLSE